MAVKKVAGARGAVGSVIAATTAVTSLRQAREGKDKLLMAYAASSLAVAVTGALVAIRAFRKGDQPE